MIEMQDVRLNEIRPHDQIAHDSGIGRSGHFIGLVQGHDGRHSMRDWAYAADPLGDVLGVFRGPVDQKNFEARGKGCPWLKASTTCCFPRTVSTLTSIFRCPSKRVTGSITYES